ncbi:glycosyltransferase family 2 protein [Crocinitomix algicola]|uniref:glycosyltransferase family 2 protein n=1 Tax=Crocinitomix algicola TaxID=1740263 RepID=UPI00082DEE25|nr:glycosyltransferase [Crocinitomix algicola]
MEELLDNYIRFLYTLTPKHFFEMFWFYFVFEFIRYFLLEFFVLNLAKVKQWVDRPKREDARRRLFIENPLVSILIPGKNEGKHIYKLVNSLREQTYKNIEIIVVDDGSDDDTPTIGRSLENARLITKFLRNDVRGGKASAANMALRFAKGKYIIHLDADCSYDLDAMENILIPFFMDENVGGVGGNVSVRNHKESLVTTLQAIEYFNTITTGRTVTSYLGIYRIISGAFGAFRADVLHQLKGWDIGPGLDGDITVKIRKKGYKIKFAQDANCLTSVPNTFKKLIKQRLRWDKSLVRFRMRKHKDVLFPNHSFRFLNFISAFENILYNVVLNFKWYVYLTIMLTFYRPLFVNIFITNVLLYTATNYVKFIMYSLYRPKAHASMSYFLVYLPCMVFYYGIYLRVVRTIAYLQELLFKKSYQDPWNPPKTSIHARYLGI